MASETSASPNGIRIWLMAARVRTLPAAVAPVLVGTALAGFMHVFYPLRFIAALIGAIFIQVGTNLSNDYSDARRGADTEDRLGPVRVTAGGLVPPKQVLMATYVSFGIAVLAGIYLIAVAGWQLLIVGAASILAGVLYTGGPRAVRLRGTRRGVRVPVLRDRRRGRLVFRADHAPRLGGIRAGGARRAAGVRRSWSSTTSATSTPTGAPASARWPSGSAATEPGRCSRRWSTRLSADPCHVVVRAAAALGAAALADIAARRPRGAHRAQPHRRRARSTRRWRRPGCCSWRSARCSPPGCCSAGDAAPAAAPESVRVKVRIEPVRASLRTPFAAAYGAVSERALLVLALEGADGVSGARRGGAARALRRRQPRRGARGARGLPGDARGLRRARPRRAAGRLP